MLECLTKRCLGSLMPLAWLLVMTKDKAHLRFIPADTKRAHAAVCAVGGDRRRCVSHL